MKGVFPNAKVKSVRPAENQKGHCRKIQQSHAREDRQRAYEIYLERGATPGDPMQDWLRAEMELSMPAKTPRSKSKVITFAA